MTEPTDGVTAVVLVDGAFADGSGWRSVYDRLTARGHRVSLLCSGWEGCAPRARLDGIDVRELRSHELRRAVGLVFEDTFLFHDTVLQADQGCDFDFLTGEDEE